MFTICPKCALTLVVTAADLRIAQGYVRCGRCLNVFNALARLSEERSAVAPEPAADSTAVAPTEQTATTPEQAAAAPPEPAAAPEPAAVAPPERAPAPSQQAVPREPPPSTLDDTGEIEFELDPSVLVTAARPPAAPSTPDVEEESAHPERQAPAPTPAPAPVESLPRTTPPAEASITTATKTPLPTPQPPAAVPARAESPSPPEPPEAPQTNIAHQLPESSFEVEARWPRAGLAWKIGAGALAIALALQIVNHYRDALAANPALRGPLSTLYSALGVKLAPRWNIHAYDVRQLGASVAGAAAGEIVVRASVKNSASRPQPLPLLRVTLQDRFGNRIAARDVPPGDYLPSSVAPSSLLAAGSRVDATMVFVDPGPQAVGFEIDACLRQRSGEVACAHGP